MPITYVSQESDPNQKPSAVIQQPNSLRRCNGFDIKLGKGGRWEKASLAAVHKHKHDSKPIEVLPASVLAPTDLIPENIGNGSTGIVQ
jgi:hypothetical protein